MKILLTISYVGTGYSGWQYQDNKITVQSVVTAACRDLFGCECDVTGCSRTDSGVHAIGFCAAVSAKEGESLPDIPPYGIVHALNFRLPPDISVKAARRVPDSFHPRYSVTGKTYRYVMLNGRVRDPFLVNRAYHVRRDLTDGDISAMNEAASHLVGRHDFTSFMAVGSKIKDTFRCVSSASVSSSGKLVEFTVTADGFLYNMVRIMAGTLLFCGTGQLKPEDIPGIIAACDRSKAGPTLPACGLYLEGVQYPEDAFIPGDGT